MISGDREDVVGVMRSTPLRLSRFALQIFFRAGLEVIKADSVYANELADVNKPGTPEHPRATCMVPGGDLANHEVAERRTASQVTDALREIGAATSAFERDAISKRTGVVLRGNKSNPHILCASLTP